MKINLTTTNADSSKGNYASSVKSIVDYTSWASCINKINTNPPLDQSIDCILDCCKKDAASWYNLIYPEYLDIPKEISSLGKDIDSELSLLIQLSEQYKIIQSPELIPPINKCLIDVQAKVNNIEGSLTKLSTDLNDFDHKTNNDSQAYAAGYNYLFQIYDKSEADLRDLQAELQRLNTNPLKNSRKIIECQNKINSKRTYIDQINTYMMTVFYDGIDRSKKAADSAKYLGQYWVDENTKIADWYKPLKNIEGRPEKIIDIDLITMQANWKVIYQNINALSNKIIKLHLNSK